MFTVKFTCPNDMQVLLGEGHEVSQVVLDNLDINVDLIEFTYSCDAGCIAMTNWESVYIVDKNGLTRLTETQNDKFATLWMEHEDGPDTFWGLMVHGGSGVELVGRNGRIIEQEEYNKMSPLYDFKPVLKYMAWKSFLELCDFLDAEENGIRYDHVAEHVWDNCKHMVKGW